MNNNKLLISESLADEDDGEESLLELLWNEGTLLTPLGISTPTAALLPPRGSSSRDVGPSSAGPQLFLEEDEMATWLHHCCNGEAAGGSDRIEEILETASTRARRCIDGNQAEEAATTTATMTTMTAVTDDDDACKVFEVGSARYSVPCTTTSSSSARVVITDQRKRKARSGKGFESNDQDAEIELGIKRKEPRQSAPTRKRASEVHNLSERRRRDRINEKMKTLRELIPRCNKSDKASMLDDAIEYLKSLQLQVQMMSSMQYNMSQIMFPGGPRYLQPMGFPIGGMQYPIMPVGPMMPHPPIAGSSAANLPAQLMPAFHQANFVSNQQYPASSSNNTISSNMAQVPNFAAHQYAAVQHFQVPYQGQTVAEPGTSKETNNSRKSTDARMK